MKNYWLTRNEAKRVNYFFEIGKELIAELICDITVELDQQTLEDLEKGIAVWDFQTELGDVIKQEHEDQYVKVVEVSNLVNRKIVPDAGFSPDLEDPANVASCWEVCAS